jgi:hypothetical protein
VLWVRYSEPMRYIISFVVVALAAGIVPSVFAQDASPTPAPFPRIQSRELRQTAQRIHLRMMEVNRTRLAGYERILERLRNMLERITAIADRHEARGADASAVYAAVSEAQQAIDEAQHAVREQASREYLLDGATDYTMREQLQGMREQLADDLGVRGTAIREAIEAARTAVQTLRNISS